MNDQEALALIPMMAEELANLAMNCSNCSGSGFDTGSKVGLVCNLCGPARSLVDRCGTYGAML